MKKFYTITMLLVLFSLLPEWVFDLCTCWKNHLNPRGLLDIWTHSPSLLLVAFMSTLINCFFNLTRKQT